MRPLDIRSAMHTNNVSHSLLWNQKTEDIFCRCNNNWSKGEEKAERNTASQVHKTFLRV